MKEKSLMMEKMRDRTGKKAEKKTVRKGAAKEKPAGSAPSGCGFLSASR